MMNQTAPQHSHSELIHESGIVGPASGDALTVKTRSGNYVAKRAASCLLTPRPGDRVALARSADEAFVLAVLELAPTSTPQALRIDGDLDLCVSGRLGIVARHGIELATEQKIATVSHKLDVHAHEVEAALGSTSLVGKVLVSRIERVKQVATRIDQIAERVSQTVDRCYRFVAKHDQLRAETIDQKASQTLTMHAKNSAITADGLLKVDGEQIHLG